MLSEDSTNYISSVTSKHYEEGQNLSGIGRWVLEKLGMKRSDYVILIILTMVASYLFNMRDRVSLQPAFFQPIQTNMYSNEYYPQDWERVSNPLVTDLESDGENEVILSFPEGHIVVAKYASVTPGADYPLPRLDKKFDYSLSSIDTNPRHAINVETGFLETYKGMGQLRRQAIVVLTNDSMVFLFTSDLKLQWSRSLSDSPLNPETALYLKESSLLVLSHSLQEGDLGSIIVGGALDVLKYPDLEQRMRAAGNQEGSTKVLHHFSLYALDGRTGDTRWSHEPGDFEEERKSPFPNYSHFKFDTKWSSKHRGEQDWSEYKGAFRRALPYTWSSAYDTKMRVDSVGPPRSIEKNKAEDYKFRTVMDLDQEYVSGLLFGGLKPHSPSERVQNPDAIFLYSEKQIQLLDLSSGRPLSSLELQVGALALGDISGDGEIEEIHVELHPGNEDEGKRKDESQKWVTLKNELQICRGQIHTLSGGRRQLAWEAELCSHPHGIDNLASSFASHVTISLLDVLQILGFDVNVREQEHTIRQVKLQLWGEEEVDISELQGLPPLLVPSVHYTHSPLNLHFTKTVRGKFHVGGATSYDVIFILSNGRVTSFGPEGHLNWQTYVNAGWRDAVKFRLRTVNPLPFGKKGLMAHSFIPHAAPLSVLSYGKQTHLLVVGISDLSLVSLEDGTIESELDLPCSPVAPSVIADFDSNGVNDVIVICRDNYIGFQLSHASGKSYTNLITLLVTGLVLVVLMHFRGSTSSKQKQELRPSAAIKNRKD
ncbi:hypothetical protein LOD99_4268 [Oopsacas minuta]|uniref:Uncharacterized protein n=1 Tax=Oopsacas minuta TaxID=111878 RepID=A0AAV7JVM5_9METZ|nr:hypothetical protein LOD99_4268 [Oopsacas minuta]